MNKCDWFVLGLLDGMSMEPGASAVADFHVCDTGQWLWCGHLEPVLGFGIPIRCHPGADVAQSISLIVKRSFQIPVPSCYPVNVPPQQHVMQHPWYLSTKSLRKHYHRALNASLCLYNPATCPVVRDPVIYQSKHQVISQVTHRHALTLAHDNSVSGPY